LQTLVRHVPRLLLLSVRQRRWDLFCLALDLAVPPLSLLGFALAAGTAMMAAAWLVGFTVLPLCLLMAANLFLASAVLLGWAAYCRQQISLAALVAAPLYAALKAPIYIAFLMRRQQQWVRTARDVRS
jgi:hypothetical protein